MSDESSTEGGAAASGGAAQAGAPQRVALPPVQITAQYIKDLSFENPNAPGSLSGGAAAPQVTVNVDVRTRQLAERQYEVVLHVRADAKSGENQAFLVELAYAGVANLENIPKEHTAPMLLMEVPRMLFPFARAVIAEATRNGGFPPLLVQPIDFAELFRKQLQALRDRQSQQKAEAASTPPAEGNPTIQ